jgi:hypothetical protein
LTFSKSILKTVSTTNDSKQEQADILIKNPLDGDTYVNQLQIFPSANFGDKAILQIFVNAIPIFDNSEDIGFFSNFKLFDLPLTARQINRGSDIKIFAWNGTDATLIECTIIIFISEVNSPQIVGSIPIQSSEIDDTNLAKDEADDKITDEGTKTTADGGSGIVGTIYTCPAGKKAIVKVVETRVKVSGSATQIRLLLRGQRIATWNIDNNNPNDYPTTIGSGGNGDNALPTTIASDARKIWSDGSYPEHNLLRRDLQDEMLSAGQTIAYDGNFSSNFNATIDYAYTIYEVDA